MPGFLYSLDFPNGKSYIGVTSKGVSWRWARHVEKALRGDNYVVSMAIRKYGPDAVTVRTLAVTEMDDEYLKDLEVKAIAAYGTLAPGGYNMTAGGNGVLSPCSEASIRRIEAFKRTAATPEYKRNAKKASNEWWYGDGGSRIEEKSRLTSALWKDPDYRKKMMEYHAKRKESKKPKPRLLTFEEKSRSQKAKWTDEYRQRISMEAKERLSSESEKARLSAQQKRLMENRDVRRKIANTLSEFGDCILSKASITPPVRRESVFYELWDKLPDEFSYWYLRDLGIKPRPVARAIRLGHFVVVRHENN